MAGSAAKDKDLANFGWQNIRVKNLRGFVDSGEIEYARMTLLFGRNSSGKTTLLRAPLLIKQSAFGATSNEALLAGSDVDFGSYKEAVYNGQVSRDIKITAVMAVGGDLHFPNFVRRADPAILDLFSRMQVEMTIHWNQRSGQPQYSSIVFSNPDTRKPTLFFDRTGPEEYEIRDRRKKLIVKVQAPLAPPHIRYAELALRDKQGDGDRDSIALSFLMYQLGLRFQATTQDLVHIGPLRETPKRAYTTDQPVVAYSSGSSVAILKSGEGIKDVRRALQKLKMANSVIVRKLAPGFIAITLQDAASGRFDNLADVGFGVSQVLPILVTLATVPPYTTVLIEQPELHLHPEAQGRLADVLYSMANERRLKLIIETHSEHILLRLQRRVAEKSITPDDLAIYFVQSGKVKRASVDRFGKVDNSAIPKGFFEDDWEDLMLMTKAAAEAAKRGD